MWFLFGAWIIEQRSRGLVVTVALLATGERYATTVAFIRLA